MIVSVRVFTLTWGEVQGNAQGGQVGDLQEERGARSSAYCTEARQVAELLLVPVSKSVEAMISCA